MDAPLSGARAPAFLSDPVVQARSATRTVAHTELARTDLGISQAESDAGTRDTLAPEFRMSWSEP